MTYWAIIQPENHDTVYWALVESEDEAKQIMSKIEQQIVKQRIHEAVWQGQINQVSTRDVATRFDCSLETARRILQAVVHGESGDKRFEAIEGGIKIANGHRFTYGYEDVTRRGQVSEKAVQHLIWFLD